MNSSISQHLLENLPEALVGLDASGTIISCNPAALALVGWKKADLLGRKICGRLVAEKNWEFFNGKINELRSGGGADSIQQSLVASVIRQDGKEIPVEMVLHGEKTPGTLLLFLVIHSLAERKDIELKPQERERRFQAIADAAPVFLWMSRTDALCDYFNQSWLDFTGKSFEQEWGVGWAEGVHAEDFQACMDTYMEAFGKREPFEMEYRLLRHDGEYRWMLDRGKPRYGADGAFAGYIGSCVDISELRMAKDLALQTSELKTNFLTNMSHEIRTPLNSIIGVVDLLLETKLTSDQFEYVGLVSRAGKALMSLINDILDFSKIESGRLTLENISFNLDEVIDNLSSMISVKALEKNLDFVTKIQNGVPLNLHGDPGRLSQVLINLLSNAVKFTAKGAVRLDIEEASAAPLGREDQIRLSFLVSDQGVGIPKEKLNLLFERFMQLDASTTRKYGGSGLGLAISRKLVELMGGDIEVRSEIQKGSTFIVTLPFTKAVVMAEKKTPSQDFNGMEALILEKDNGSMVWLQQALESWQVSVNRTADTRAVLAFAKKAAANGGKKIIFIPAKFPGGGFEFVEKLSGTLDVSKTVIMVLPFEHRPNDINLCRKMGVSGYISMPLQPYRLKEALSAALQSPGAQPEGGAQPSPGIAKATGPSDAAKAPAPFSDPRKLKILLVEDFEENQKVIAAFLKNTPYEITCAANGLIALEHFQKQQPDLVLMDMQMPVMDGYAATQAMRSFEKKHGLRPTPIVALTANAMQEDLRKSIDVGCNSYLTKPVLKNRLLSAILENTKEDPHGK